MIGNGDAVRVARQVVENLFRTAEGWLGVDDPVLSAKLPKEVAETAGRGEILDGVVELQPVLLEEFTESWVIGELFQEFAFKYLGIRRGIPLSNTNQIWGLAWGALVFGELASANRGDCMLVLAGSVLMNLGALAISTAIASSQEHLSTTDKVLLARAAMSLAVSPSIGDGGMESLSPSRPACSCGSGLTPLSHPWR
jgi:hypothetical protein